MLRGCLIIFINTLGIGYEKNFTTSRAFKDTELITILKIKTEPAYQSAVAEIFNRYGEAVFKKAILYADQDLKLAEDTTEKAFLKFFTNIKNGKHASSVYQSLIRCLKESFLLKLKKSVGKFLTLGDLDKRFKKHNARFEGIEEKVLDVVKQLKTYEKQIVVLKYFNNKTYTEISKSLKIPIGTVSSVLFQIKGKLGHYNNNLDSDNGNFKLLSYYIDGELDGDDSKRIKILLEKDNDLLTEFRFQEQMKKYIYRKILRTKSYYRIAQKIFTSFKFQPIFSK